MELTRRNLVASGAGIAALAAFSGINLANAVEADAQGNPVFAGRAQGLRGHIGAHVTLGEGGIEAIDIVENTEKPDRLADAAIASVVPAILAGQTVDVDVVSGATFSSLAIMGAVRQALEAAGVADRFQGAPEAAAVEAPADEECDVLVVGAGVAGCMAAVAARYSDFGLALNDLHVVLAEKQGFVGGSSCLAGGTIMGAQPLNSTENIDKFFEAEYPTYFDPAYPLDKGLARKICEVSGGNLLQLQQLGLPIVTIAGMQDASAYTEIPGWFDEPRPNPTRFGEGVWDFAGWRIMQFMDERLVEAGVDVRVNTKAVELVCDEAGAVTGVVFETPAGSYTISAKKVILATGGFTQNRDLVAEYAPTYLTCIPNCNAGSTGDAILMTRNLGGVVDGFDSFGGPLGVEMRYGAFNDMGYDFYLEQNFPAGFNCVIVNNEGVRFMTDSAALVANESTLPYTVMSQPDGQCWSIFDSANEAAAIADASVMQDYIFRAETVEELAGLIGVPADALVATIDGYNQMQSSGTDDAEFEVPADQMAPVTQPPFYAVSCRGTACYDCQGLRVNENCELVTAEGAVVENLYVIGEASYCGWTFAGLGASIATGRIAGDHAREAIA